MISTPVVPYAPLAVDGHTPAGHSPNASRRLVGKLRSNFGPKTFCTNDLLVSMLETKTTRLYFQSTYIKSN
ncbi:hypothetical protein DPMN_068427 [Dreissena polymorpha]|uniref:Uncharacterized protein n=1 Tax=Dreissena polymorpha TaxID=45954 RepID=A0A9D3YZ64_DREPO|nr:hypothetical protein DPMN_068427 [Dreissena polymorpha]